MRIDSSYLGMESARTYKSQQSSRRYGGLGGGVYDSGSQTPSFLNYLNEKDGNTEEELKKSEESNAPLKALAILKGSGNPMVSKVDDIGTDAQTSFAKLHQLFLKEILALLMNMRGKYNKEAESVETTTNGNELGQYELVNVTEGIETTIEEYESFSFSCKGVVNTADGRSINVDMDVSMSRSFKATYCSEYTCSYLQAIDPLVVNFDGLCSELTKTHFHFDLDCDGAEEEVSMATRGSGFLALDKNGDGKINDGSELFGPTTGDGFKELAAYDEDGNGWIDENDSIFDKLLIRVLDDDGKETLYKLKDKDVGAIYLGNQSTVFGLAHDNTNNIDGIIRSTGMFLYEDGRAGTIQHVDLVS